MLASGLAPRTHVHRLTRLEELSGAVATPAAGQGAGGDGEVLSAANDTCPARLAHASDRASSYFADGFRQRIEAMRTEGGESWLKVFAESEHHDKTHCKREDGTSSKPRYSVKGEGQSEASAARSHPVSLEPQFPAFTFSRGATIRPRESLKAPWPSSSMLSLPTLLVSPAERSQKENDVPAKSTLADAGARTAGPEVPDSSAAPEVTETPDAPSLPAGKVFHVEAFAYESSLSGGGKHIRRLPAVKRRLVVTDNEILEVAEPSGGMGARREPAVDGAVCARPLAALLRVDGVSGSGPLSRLLDSQKAPRGGRQPCVRLVFCLSRYDPPVRCDYDADEEQLGELRVLLAARAKRNWDSGYAAQVLKQGKCLSCGWAGLLADERGMTWGESEEDECASSNNAGQGGNELVADATERASVRQPDGNADAERRCVKCDGTFLVEFYGHETDHKATGDSAGGAAAVAKGGASSTVVMGETTSLLDIIPSVLRGVSETLGLSVGATESNGPNQLMPDTVHREEHQNGDAEAALSAGQWTTSSYRDQLLRRWKKHSPRLVCEGLPQFRNAGNALRLFLKLNVFMSDSESLMAWLPTSRISHGPAAFTPSASKWSILGAQGPAVPAHCPVETPVYIALSSKAIYLFEQKFPYSPERPGRSANGPIPLVFSPAEVARAEKEPDQYLHLAHTIPVSSIARVDCGPNRQTMTFHFVLTPVDEKGRPGPTCVHPSVMPDLPGPAESSSTAASVPMESVVVPAGRQGPPLHSCTFLVRDRLLCSDFLNFLLVLCYEGGVHLSGNKVKLVSHDVEWAVRNLRDQAFVGPAEAEENNIDVDPASGNDVVIDKVSFDFIKMYYAVGYLDVDGTVTAGADGNLSRSPADGHSPDAWSLSSALTAATRVPREPDCKLPQAMLLGATIVGTPTYVYLVAERHDVWPPPVEDISTVYNVIEAARCRLHLSAHRRLSACSSSSSLQTDQGIAAAVTPAAAAAAAGFTASSAPTTALDPTTSSPKSQRRWSSLGSSRAELAAAQMPQYRRLKLESVARIRKVERVRLDLQFALLEGAPAVKGSTTATPPRQVVFGNTASGWEVVVRVFFANAPPQGKRQYGSEEAPFTGAAEDTGVAAADEAAFAAKRDPTSLTDDRPASISGSPTAPTQTTAAPPAGVCEPEKAPPTSACVIITEPGRPPKADIVTAETSIAPDVVDTPPATTTTAETREAHETAKPSRHHHYLSGWFHAKRGAAAGEAGAGSFPNLASDTRQGWQRTPSGKDPAARVPDGPAVWDLFFATSASADECVDALRDLCERQGADDPLSRASFPAPSAKTGVASFGTET